MNAKTMLAAFAAISLAIPLIADSKTFPLAGGDLSDASAWGDVGLPDEDDMVLVNQSGTYTASSDISIGVFGLQNSGVRVDFAHDRKVTLFEPDSTASTALQFGGEGCDNFISGGFWYAPNAGRVHFIRHGNHVPSKSSSLTISGSVFTNHNAAVMITRLHNSTVTFTDGAKLYVIKDLTGVEKANDGTGVVFTNNLVIIKNGSELTVGQHLYPDSRGIDNLFLVEGEDSLVKVAGTVYFGGGTSCVFRISNNAHAELKGVISGRAGDNNRIVVDSGATVNMGNLTIGQNAGTKGNGVELRNAGAVICGRVDLGIASSSVDSYVVVSNTLFTTGSWNIGSTDGTSTGSKLILQGSSPSVTSVDKSIFKVNAGSEIIWNIPPEGYAADVIPLKITKFDWPSEDVRLTVKCKEFRRRGGGKVELIEANHSTWLNLGNGAASSGKINEIVARMNADRAKTGCFFAVEGVKLVCTIDPLPGLVISIK
jgi:hypothetical protein